MAALSGGVLTKLLDRHFGSRQRFQDRLADMEARLREELRKEKEDLRGEIATLRKELDDWKGKYFDVLQKYGEAQVVLSATRQALKDAEDELASMLKKS